MINMIYSICILAILYSIWLDVWYPYSLCWFDINWRWSMSLLFHFSLFNTKNEIHEMMKSNSTTNYNKTYHYHVTEMVCNDQFWHKVSKYAHLYIHIFEKVTIHYLNTPLFRYCILSHITLEISFYKLKFWLENEIINNLKLIRKSFGGGKKNAKKVPTKAYR